MRAPSNSHASSFVYTPPPEESAVSFVAQPICTKCKKPFDHKLNHKGVPFVVCLTCWPAVKKSQELKAAKEKLAKENKSHAKALASVAPPLSAADRPSLLSAADASLSAYRVSQHNLAQHDRMYAPLPPYQPHYLPPPREPRPDHRLDDSSVISDLSNNSYASYAPFQYVASVLHLVDSLISPVPSSCPSVSTFLSAATTPSIAPSVQKRVQFAEPYLFHASSSSNYTRPPGYPRSSSGKRSASHKRSLLLGHHAIPPSNIHQPNCTSRALPSFAKSSDPHSLWFFDNAASFSTTNDASLLYDITNCPSFPIGGINDGVQVKQVGRLKFLPHQINLCYYTPDASVSLISLGYLRRRDVEYFAPQEVGLPLVVTFNGAVLARSDLGPNNLHPVPSACLAKRFPPITDLTNQTDSSYSSFSFPHIAQYQTPPTPAPALLVPTRLLPVPLQPSAANPHEFPTTHYPPHAPPPS